jgi:hypothetical protein
MPGEMRFPGFEFLGRNRECQMQGTAAVMPGYHSIRSWGGLIRHSVLEEQEHLPAGDLEGAHTVIFKDKLESENPLIERPGLLKIINVKGCFQDMRDARHG